MLITNPAVLTDAYEMGRAWNLADAEVKSAVMWRERHIETANRLIREAVALAADLPNAEDGREAQRIMALMADKTCNAAGQREEALTYDDIVREAEVHRAAVIGTVLA